MFKIGFSKDIHNKIFGKEIILGGLKFESKFKAEAHSDGDILIHSICEAIMGALGIGDLGKYFNKDTNDEGFSSELIVDFINKKLFENKYIINNIDCMIMLDDFNISNISDELVLNLSRLFNIKKNTINIKATTSEKNYKNIIECSAIVSIKEK